MTCLFLISYTKKQALPLWSHTWLLSLRLEYIWICQGVCFFCTDVETQWTMHDLERKYAKLSNGIDGT